jgi:hypothetical protein
MTDYTFILSTKIQVSFKLSFRRLTYMLRSKSVFVYNYAEVIIIGKTIISN